MADSYNFTFLQNIHNDTESLSKFVRLYRFKSTKTNRTYLVRVERYPHDVYIVKFYPTNLSNSKDRYSILTNDKEPRRIVNTCINILMDIFSDNPASSFGFIGSNSINEGKENTKRYRVYKTIINTKFGNETFEHYYNVKNSAYMLLRKTELAKNSDLIDKIENYFYLAYNMAR